MGREKIHQQYQVWISLLNILACIAVVTMHCNGSAFWNYADNWNWKLAVIVGAMADWAVPVFFMISGANLINYISHYSTKIYVKKRVMKTLVPFLLWSVIPLIYYFARGKYGTQPFTISWILDMVFNTKINETYWFFIPLFSIYTCIPVLSFIDKAKQRDVFCYLALVGGVTIFFLPLFSQMVLKIPYNNFFRMPMAGGFLIYAILGYLLKTEPLSYKSRLVIYALGITGFLIQSFGTIYLSVMHDSLRRDFQEGLGIPVLFESMAIFILFKYEINCWIKRPRLVAIVSKLSSYSFGVYLLHLWIIRKLPQHIGDFGNKEWPWIFSAVIFTYIISLCLTWIIKKIPGLRAIIP